MKVKKNKPIIKQLSEKYGGKWHHIPFQGMWICDELNLQAWRVHQSGYDMDGNPMENPFPLLDNLYVYGLKSGTEKFYPNR